MRVAAALLITAACAHIALAQTTAKPPIPPAAPTKGAALPVIAEGFDYTQPAVLKALARDGEGVAIAYDGVDDDARPFAPGAATTALIEQSGMLIAPIRVDASDIAWTRALAFAKRLPAKVIVILAPVGERRALVEAAANASPDRIFFVPASRDAKLSAPNVFTVAALPASGERVRAETADVILAPPAATREAPTSSGTSAPDSSGLRAMLAVTLFGCIEPGPAKTAADVVKRFISRAQKGAPGTAPLLEHCGLPRR